MRLAVRYTPLHLKFPVHSQNASLDLRGTRFVLRFGLSWVVRNSVLFPWDGALLHVCSSCHRMFVYSPYFRSCTPCVYCASPRAVQVRFPSISLLSSSSTVNNSEYFLMVPAGCNSSFPVRSHQGFFLGFTYPLRLALWHLIIYIPRTFPSPCSPPFTLALLGVTHSIPVPQGTRPLVPLFLLHACTVCSSTFIPPFIL